MQLTPAQREAYARDGFLLFPDRVTAAEVALLRSEVERLWNVDAEGTVREGANRAPKSMFRLHKADGATAAPPFRALARSPRMLGVAQQLLSDEQLYLHHSKVNVKAAIEVRCGPGTRISVPGTWMASSAPT